MSASIPGRATRSTSATRTRRCSSPIFSTKVVFSRRMPLIPGRSSIARSFRTIWLMIAKSSWRSIASRSWRNISSSSSGSSTPASATWKMDETSLGKSRLLLLLGDLLLQPGLELVGGGDPGDDRAPDLLHALQLQLQILGAHPGEAEVVVGVAAETRVEVLDDLVDLDLHLVVGEAVDLEALHDHVLEVVQG